MRTVWGLVVVVAPLAGCFYVDPINERPGADINRVDPTLPKRGDFIDVIADIYDPDGDPTTVEWRASACDAAGCDAPFASAATYTFTFAAPANLLGGAPTTYVEVALVVTDSYGARSAPRENLIINLDNADPELEPLQRSGRFFRGAYPVGTPVTIAASATDADDLAARLAYADAVLFAPDGATLEDATLTAAPPETDGARRERTWTLVADAPGQWEVLVAVADPLGAEAMREISIPYAPDHPPCLHVADPAFPPPDARIVLDEPRRFSVLVVDDDLDVYPPPAAGDPLLGTAGFRWSLDGAPLATGVNAVELDPAAFDPGDVLALRVDVDDRVTTRPACAADEPSCELVTGCAQRRTWRVEVR